MSSKKMKNLSIINFVDPTKIINEIKVTKKTKDKYKEYPGILKELLKHIQEIDCEHLERIPFIDIQTPNIIDIGTCSLTGKMVIANYCEYHCGNNKNIQKSVWEETINIHTKTRKSKKK